MMPSITPIQANVLLVFTEGLLSFVSPCILPMLPVYLVYLMGAEEGMRSRKRLLINTLGFIAGFTTVFVLLGAAATGIGALLRAHQALLSRISGVIMVVFGLTYMGVIRIPFLEKDARIQYVPSTPSFLKSMLFGMAFSFGWSSCTGAYLGSALLLASNSQTVWKGIGLLFAYSMGLGLPFFITSLLYTRLTPVLNWLKKHHRPIRIASGVLLLLIGLALALDLFGYYQRLFNW